MSKTHTTLPLSAVIFDRTQKGIPDVPVFASALKQKVNTATIPTPALSLGAQAILARAGLVEAVSNDSHNVPKQPVATAPTVVSTLRADPVRGQTTGFAPSVEPVSVPTQTPPIATPAFVEVVTTSTPQPVQNNATVPVTVSAFFAEDPTLVRWSAGDTSKLHEYLQVLTSGVAQEVETFSPPVIPRITIPSMESELLATEHHSGIIERVIIPQVPLTVADRLEPATILLRSHFWKLVRQLHKLSDPLPELRSELATTLATLWTQLHTYLATISKVSQQFFYTIGRSTWVWTHDAARLLSGKLVGSAHSIPHPSIPSINISDWKEVVGSKARTITVPTPSLTLPTVPAFPIKLESIKNELLTTLEALRARLSSVIQRIRARVSGIKLQSFSHVVSRALIATSLVMMLLTVGPMVALEANSWKQKIIYSLTPKATEQESAPVPTVTPTPNPEPDKQFQILIPKLGVNSRIIANVNPAVEKEYTQALQQGVAHAAGTGLPGEENTHNRTIFVFGHSTNGSWNVARYNALFYSLKDLIIGDSITVWFWGKEFDYTVKERKIVEPNDVSFLQPQTDKERLILQTCWPPGTTWKRLIVIAEPTS